MKKYSFLLFAVVIFSAALILKSTVFKKSSMPAKPLPVQSKELPQNQVVAQEPVAVASPPQADPANSVPSAAMEPVPTTQESNPTQSVATSTGVQSCESDMKELTIKYKELQAMVDALIAKEEARVENWKKSEEIKEKVKEESGKTKIALDKQFQQMLADHEKKLEQIKASYINACPCAVK